MLQMNKIRVVLLCCSHCSKIHHCGRVTSVQSTDVESRESVRDCVVRAVYVTNVGGELGNEVQMPDLSGRVSVRVG